MKYYSIPSNNSSVTEKHVVEDDILFTNPLAVRVEITGGFVYIVFDFECVMMCKGPVVEIEAFHSIAE